MYPRLLTILEISQLLGDYLLSKEPLDALPHMQKKKVTTNPKNKTEKIKYIFALSKSARSKPELIFDSHSTKQM